MVVWGTFSKIIQKYSFDIEAAHTTSSINCFCLARWNARKYFSTYLQAIYPCRRHRGSSCIISQWLHEISASRLRSFESLCPARTSDMGSCSMCPKTSTVGGNGDITPAAGRDGGHYTPTYSSKPGWTICGIFAELYHRFRSKAATTHLCPNYFIYTNDIMHTNM